jgi:hypothetical protein
MTPMGKPHPTEDQNSPTLLSSVASIIDGLASGVTPETRQFFQKLVFVGVLSARLSLMQSGTTLYVVDTFRLVRHVAYQRVLVKWGQLPYCRFTSETVPGVADLLAAFLQSREGDLGRGAGQNSSNCVEDLVTTASRVLVRWRRMYRDYFAIHISKDGKLCGLPLVFGASWPVPQAAIPEFLWRVAADVDYTDEMRCLSHIARLIAEALFGQFFRHDEVTEEQRRDAGREPPLVEAIRFGLIPAATSGRCFHPTLEHFTDGTLRPLVSVESLYRVFERC